jgi:hypothetical protein
MEEKSLIGQVVTLQSSAGPIQRVVVADLGNVILVCRQEEYQQAKSEAREPATIGFKRGDIVTT